MLNFIVGRACTGKSYEILERVAAASVSGKAIIIVPEQFSFETERAIIKRKNANTENISVLSFSRLYDSVVAFSGRGSANFISDFEKTILTGRAIKAAADNLKVFGKYANNKDFPRLVADTIRDFKFTGATANDLILASQNVGGICGAKLYDIGTIMSVYDALLSNKYIDPADMLTKLYNLLGEVEYFANKEVFIDSFTGFTGQQYKLIGRIIEQAKSVTFSFSSKNPEDTAFDSFYNVNTTITKIKEIAKNRGVKQVDFTTLTKHYYSNEKMASLEAFLSGNEPDTLDISGNVSVISCENNREEALAAANIISREVKDNNYRFKDFIMVARNAENYAGYVLKQCENHNIACFMDKSVLLTYTPLCIYIFSLFESLNYSTDSILKLLKLNLLDFTEKEVSELEDYIFIWDIKASDWNTKWKMSVKGFQNREDSEYNLKKLEAINQTREKIVSIISEFNNDFAGTPKNRVKAIYNHLVQKGVDKKLSALCSFLENEGDTFNASITEQSWDTVISVLDSIVKVFDDKVISNSDFCDAFSIAAENAKISNVPQLLDEVTFGAADRIRPSKPKISIILGANQGVFPQISNSCGLFAATDKEKIKLAGIELDDNTIKGAIEENYLVYSMLCCPTDKVYILYSKKTVKGDELEPSAFVNSILNKFTSISATEFSLSIDGDFVPRSPKSAFSELGSLNQANISTVKHSLLGYEEFSNKLAAIDSINIENSFEITTQTADKLFSNKINISATDFDNFHKCSLRYLLDSGLNLKKLRKADLNVMQRGTLAHYVLEKIVLKHGKKLAELSAAQISAEVDVLIGEYMSSISGSELIMTPRFAYLLERIAVSVKEIVVHIANEFAQSDFEPKFCELVVGENGDIPSLEYVLHDGSVATLVGEIDRVDVYKNNVRVVDYKTGSRSFVLSDTLVGLNMQMLLYLRAFIKNGSSLVENPEPAGILYMPAKKSADTKTLKMNGLISDNAEIISAMEKGNTGLYIPKKTASTSDYISSEIFGLVFEKIDSFITEMGNTIRKGEFSANPTDGIKNNACSYCVYADICRSSNIKHNAAVKYSNSEIIVKLKEGEDSGI